MPLEIERRFLPANETWRQEPDIQEHTYIEQGYFDHAQLYFDIKQRKVFFTQPQSNLLQQHIIIPQRDIDEIVSILSGDRTWAARTRLSEKAAWFTLKGPRVNAAAIELEYSLELTQAQSLLQLCPWSLRKLRYCVEHERHTFEIDEFQGDHTGLIIIEVELSHRDEPLALPPWAGEEIADPAFSNMRLARDGVPWHKLS